MAIGAALYAVFSYLFNGTVFVVPSVSQVALRPAIAIPMFFGFAFGPTVGLFTGAVGNMFGDALTGFGLSPQWSVGNGLVGMIAGMVFLFKDKKKSIDTVLIISAVLTLLVTALFFLNQDVKNGMVYPFDQPVSPLAGVRSSLVWCWCWWCVLHLAKMSIWQPQLLGDAGQPPRLGFCGHL